MNKILAMREKRGEVWDKAKAFLNEHQDENGMLSPEDAAQYERMEQEVVDLGHAIEREERAAQMEREYLERFVGRTLPVLFEEERDGLWRGHTTRYTEVALQSGENLHNQIRQVTFTAVEGSVLLGREAD